MVDGSLEVNDALLVEPSLVTAKNLAVRGTVETTGNTKISGELEVIGESSFNGLKITNNKISAPGTLEIVTGKPETVFYSKVRAIGSDPNFDDTIPDYLATMGYVNNLMLSTMSDSQKQKLFQALLDAASETGVDILKSDFLSSVSFVENPRFNSKIPGQCNTGYFPMAMDKEFEYTNGKVTGLKLKLNCQLPQPRPGTPYNCEWQIGQEIIGVNKSNGQNITRGYFQNTNAAYKLCTDGKKAISGSCGIFETNSKTKLNQSASIIDSYALRLNNTNEDCACENTTCTNCLGFTQACSGNNCNAWTCKYNLAVGQLYIKAYCCDVSE